jgi:hypothetical protein
MDTWASQPWIWKDSLLSPISWNLILNEERHHFRLRFKQNDLYINGERIKVIAGLHDSIQTDDVVYEEDALITTCNHPEAHFAIASKLKIVPDRLAVIDSSYVKSRSPYPISFTI